MRLVLGVRPLPPDSHTAELVHKAVEEIFAEWNIDDSKKYRIQTDNGSNVAKCFRDFREVLYIRKQKESAPNHENEIAAGSTCHVLSYADPNIEISDGEEESDIDDNILDDSSVEKLVSEEQAKVADERSNYDQLEEEFEMRFGAKLHLRCFAHSLQRCLCNLDADPDFCEFKKSVLRLVNSISHSSRAQQLLVEKSGLNLVKPCNTRWNFFSDVLERLLLLRNVVNDVCHELKFDTLRNSEWEKVCCRKLRVKTFKSSCLGSGLR